MKLSIKAGSTSQSINVFIQDSSSTTGAGLTGLAYNTGSLVAYYALPKAAAVAITLATLAAVTTAWASGGFKEIDATNMPGWYRLDLPNAAIASGRFVNLHLKGATNMAPCPIEIELTATDNQDGVRAGMTALPNAVAGATGGVVLVDASNSVKIQTGLKRGTALANMHIVMVDTTYGNPQTGKTVSVSRLKDGGTFASATPSTATEASDGLYLWGASSGDTTALQVTFMFTATGCRTQFLSLLFEP